MKRRKKYDIYVHNTFRDYTLTYFFGIVFCALLLPNIHMYLIQHKNIGWHLILASLLIIIFGFLTVGSYAVMARKVYVKGNTIKIRNWYGKSKKCNVKDIDKLIFDKESGKVDAITIVIEDTEIIVIDYMINYKELLDYLVKNVDPLKIEYKRMTKKLLKEILRDCDIPEQLFNLDASKSENGRICLVKEKKQYIVNYRKDNVEMINESFDEESKALLFILEQFEEGRI